MAVVSMGSAARILALGGGENLPQNNLRHLAGLDIRPT
jgi:hypothetical protein